MQPPSWHTSTQLLGLTLSLTPNHDADLHSAYSAGLHAWLLHQIQATDPKLSKRLHDDANEKAFTLSGLNGQFIPSGQRLRLDANTTYTWTITILSQSLAKWVAKWVKSPPDFLEVGQESLPISHLELTLPATTYTKLSKLKAPAKPIVRLSFASPTSFRSKGHHLPLPIPRNLFHSYLRRWNDLSGRPPIEPDPFLAWIEQMVIIQGCQVRTLKVAAGKRGSVTGFVGAIELGLARAALDSPEYVQLFYTLGQFAPYCGTGHKTTFGLGQTRLGWTDADAPTLTIDPATHTPSQLLAQRIDELTDRFIAQRHRQGGDRAREIAEKWATILARREIGDSLQQIAVDMQLSYETARTYSKRARRELKAEE